VAATNRRGQQAEAEWKPTVPGYWRSDHQDATAVGGED
jgi:hypothetical protein